MSTLWSSTLQILALVIDLPSPCIWIHVIEVLQIFHCNFMIEEIIVTWKWISMRLFYNLLQFSRLSVTFAKHLIMTKRGEYLIISNEMLLSWRKCVGFMIFRSTYTRLCKIHYKIVFPVLESAFQNCPLYGKTVYNDSTAPWKYDNF